MKNQQWKIEIKETEEIENNTDKAEIVKESKIKRIGIITLIGLVCSVLVILCVWKSGSFEKEDMSEAEKLLQVGDYEQFKYEMLDNISLDESTRSKNREILDQYFIKIYEKYSNSSSDIMDKRTAHFMSVFYEEFDYDLDAFLAMEDSKFSFRKGILNYENENYKMAYNMFSNVLEDDVNYPKAIEYMEEINKKRSGDYEIEVWYTNDIYKKAAENIENLYKKMNFDNTYIRNYNIKFKYVYVDQNELNDRLESQIPNLVLCDPDTIEYNCHYVYGLSTEMLCYNTEMTDAQHVKNLDTILDGNYPGTDKKLYMNINDSDIFKLFIKVDGQIDPTNIYTMNSLNYVMENKNRIYSGDDGMELFKEGKIPVAIVDSTKYQELKHSMGDKLAITILPDYMDSYAMNGRETKYSVYYGFGNDDNLDIEETLLDGVLSDNDLTPYLWRYCSLVSNIPSGYDSDCNIVVSCLDNIELEYEVDEDDKKIDNIKNYVLNEATSRDDIVNYIKKYSTEEMRL